MDYSSYKKSMLELLEATVPSLEKDKKIFNVLDIVSNREKTEAEVELRRKDIELKSSENTKTEAEIEKIKAETKAIEVESSMKQKTERFNRIKIGAEIFFAGVSTIGAIAVPIMLNTMCIVAHRDEELKYSDGESWTMKTVFQKSLENLKRK